MTSLELCKSFFESIKSHKQQGLGPQMLGEKAPVALLFAKDEVTFDPDSSRIEIPGLGEVELETDAKLPVFDWVATVKDQADETWSIVLGCGNPYLAQLDQGLPIVNGAVIAIPACLNPAFKSKSAPL